MVEGTLSRQALQWELVTRQKKIKYYNNKIEQIKIRITKS